MSAIVGLPVLRREMRFRMLDPLALGLLTGYLLALAAIEAVYLLGGTASSASGGGAPLFDRLVLAQLVLLSVLTPVIAADAVSGERQRGTWDVLVMTSMPLAGILWSKLTSRLAFLFLLLVVALPIVAVCFLFGDLAPPSALAAYAVLIGSVVGMAALSMFISSLISSLRRSMLFGIVLCLAFTIAGAGFIAAAAGFWHPFAVPDAARSPAMPIAAAINPVAALDSALPGASLHSRLFSSNLPLWIAFLPFSVGFASVCLLGSLLGANRAADESGPR